MSLRHHYWREAAKSIRIKSSLEGKLALAKLELILFLNSEVFSDGPCWCGHPSSHGSLCSELREYYEDRDSKERGDQ
jgi:hypothetical protein